jgi:L-alanine-DL-glutamate epimerase-like enolase superfamily enzyme
VLGQDDGDLSALGERVMEREHKFPGSHLVRALGGVDTALWDLEGKRAGRPVCELTHLQHDVPALVGDHLAGNLLLDELITRRIGLEELNDAFDALRAGEGARSVLVLG